LRLANEVGEAIPGGTKTGAPPYGVLEIHPQSWSDRVRPNHFEADGF
jgi:hypothetical protein